MKTKIVSELTILLLCLLSSLSVFSATRQMEYLDRGVVAVKVSGGVYVSWRFLGTDDAGIGFNLYRDGTKVNSSVITGGTNYTDEKGTTNSVYTVRMVENGVEGSDSKSAKVWAQFYKTLKLDRPGSSYTPNDMSVGDVDGDGQYELFVKWDPSDAKDNSQSGVTSNVYIDCYTLEGEKLWRVDLGINIRAGAHYTQFQVYDFDGDGKAEMACKTAPGTKDGQGKYVLMGSDSPTADYRNSDGYVLSGPEYLTMFNGETGAEMSTIAYNPVRGTVSGWGDSYGNRVDRFLACTAYLDGVHPSLVMCRGYYTRSTLWAVDFKDGKLVQRWYHNSPTSGKGAYGEGFHNLTVADVDQDGKDEIVYGSACVDDDGSLYYRTGFGHGDAMHVSDMDPDNDVLEGWFVHEEKNAEYSYELRNLKTGAVVFGIPGTGKDNGRGLAADIDASHKGFEMWSSANTNVFDCKGNVISTKRPSVNFRIYWDGDLQDELLDGTTITKWNGNGTSEVINFSKYNNSASINGTKSNPNLCADILGDWREEVIFYNSSDPSQIMIFTTTTPTDYRLFTLMHDPVYRMDVAWQNTAYNQPPHLGFFIGDGLSKVTQPDIYVVGEEEPSTQTLSVTPQEQTIFSGYGITPITITYGGAATGVDIQGELNGLTKTQEGNTITLSGKPESDVRLSVQAIGGDGESIQQEIVVNVVRTDKKKVAYVTDMNGANYANDTRILPALKACDDLYVVEVDANEEADLTPYDLIVVSEVAGSACKMFSQLRGIDKPMLTMKVHAYKSGVWSWANTGYGDDTESTTITVADAMKTHPMFRDVTFSGNDIQMVTSVNTKALTYMNPGSFTSTEGSILSIATIKDKENVNILEVEAGSNISGTYLPQSLIQIGLNSSSYANLTDDAVSVVKNACYYLLKMIEWESVGVQEPISNESSTLQLLSSMEENEVMVWVATSHGEKEAEMSLYDMMGRRVCGQILRLTEGVNRISFPVSVETGVYMLQLMTEAESIRGKILVR